MLFCTQSKLYNLLCCGTISCFSQQNTDILYNIITHLSAFQFVDTEFFMPLLQTCYTHAFWEVPGKCNDGFICLASQTIMTENIPASETLGIHTHTHRLGLSSSICVDTIGVALII